MSASRTESAQNVRGEFYSDYEKKYCSESCHDKAVSYEGKAIPTTGGKATTNCEICGTVFEYYPSEKPGEFCANCVENEPWRHVREIERDENPRWNGGKLTLSCDVCDGTVERHPSAISRGGHAL